MPSNDEWVDDAADWKDEPAAGAVTTMHNKGMPPPQPPDTRGLLQRYFSAMGRADPMERAGSIVGGVAGGMLGGIPGAMLGAGIGRAGGKSPPMPPHYLDSFQSQDMPKMQKPDMEGALADAGTQGIVGGAMKGLGYGAAKAGFPRVAGLLGAKPPQQAVLDVAPPGVDAISTPTLRNIDTAGAEQGPVAAKAWGSTEAELARQELLMARLAEKAKGAMGPIQSRMATRDTAELLPKTQAFSKTLDNLNLPEDVRKAAFADAPSVEQSAIDPATRAARQDMVTAAMPQRADANALKNGTRFIANAEARGVTGPSSKYAGEASGLTQLTGTPQGNNEWLKGVAERAKLPGPMSQAASAIIPKGGLSPDRVVQTTGALLGSRSEQSINPELAKMLSNSSAYRASPTAQLSTEALRQLLAQLGGGK